MIRLNPASWLPKMLSQSYFFEGSLQRWCATKLTLNPRLLNKD